MNKKKIARGMAKQLRVKVFTDEEIRYVDKDLLVKLFLDEISERSWKKDGGRTVIHGSDYLWYISFEGRLAMVKRGGSKCNAERLLKKKLIYKDTYGIYRATQVLDGCGCQHPAHRPIINALSRGRWTDYIVQTLSDILDGGHKLDYVIDTNFETAYAPDYDINTHIDDLVCSYSCMSGRGEDAQNFYGNIDGCKVMRFLKDGEDVGRCLVYTKDDVRHFMRIYCQEEYQKDCLFTLRSQMKPQDKFGRSEYIEDFETEAHFDRYTPNMYLDGNHYGFKVKNGRLLVTAYGYDDSGESTSDDTFVNVSEDIGICDNCGEWMIKDARGTVHNKYDDYWYCSEECAESAGMMRCAYCGEFIDEEEDYISTSDGVCYCCADCADGDGYVRLDSTGEWVLRDYTFTPDDGVSYYNDEDDARENGWETCADCGEWFVPRYTCQDGKYRCDTCRNKDGWELMYVKKEQKDEETSGD